MRKMTALLLAALLAGLQPCCVLAEQAPEVAPRLESDEGSFFDHLNAFLTDTLESAGELGAEAWDSFSGWAEGAWGDASVWVEQAWKDSAVWAEQAWGDVSAWAEDAYNAASDAVQGWWTKTLDTVTQSAKGAWGWVEDGNAELKASCTEAMKDLKDAADAGAEAQAEAACRRMLKAFDLSDEDTDKVWKALEAYAEHKGISTVTAVRLALPYLTKLHEDSAKEENGRVSAVSVVLYLAAALENLGITDEAAAEDLARQLDAVLGVE